MYSDAHKQWPKADDFFDVMALPSTPTKLTILLRKTIFGSYTYLHPATGTFTAIDLSLCSPDILMEIDFMVESDSYGSDHFPII